jgi:ribonuclease HII
VTEDLWSWESRLQQSGLVKVAGVDEAGRGPLAGPVVAAAVILPPAPECRLHLPALCESKQLSPKRRVELFELIKFVAISIGIGRAGVKYIDRFNILEATRVAMKRALANLTKTPDHVLVDAVCLDSIPCSTEAVIHGDLKCACIAAASIIAKVDRDRIMMEWDQMYPGYAFARNKGYGTAEHLAALARLGPSPIHRRTFRPVRLAGHKRMGDNVQPDNRETR